MFFYVRSTVLSRFLSFECYSLRPPAGLSNHPTQDIVFASMAVGRRHCFACMAVGMHNIFASTTVGRSHVFASMAEGRRHIFALVTTGRRHFLASIASGRRPFFGGCIDSGSGKSPATASHRCGQDYAYWR